MLAEVDLVKELLLRLPPGRVYVLKSLGWRVRITGYNANGTVNVSVPGDHQEILGVEPGQLEAV